MAPFASSHRTTSISWGDITRRSATRHLVCPTIPLFSGGTKPLHRRETIYHRAMTFEIRPYDGVGPLTFGMSIRNARAALAEPLATLGRGWAKVVSFLKDSRRDG